MVVRGKRHRQLAKAEDDNDWVVVKKQKVNILIPPLPPLTNPSNLLPNHLQPMPIQADVNEPLARRRPDPPKLTPILGRVSFIGGMVSVNQKLRASNLDTKLKRAGGLRQWLASLGLVQFVGILEGRNVGKFGLVRLSMQKLKDMGFDAVGPRRKLVHALDCLCQPYCFENM